MEIEVIVTDPRVLVDGLPAAQTSGSAGLDLRVYLPADFDAEVAGGYMLAPGEQVVLDTGLRLWIKDPRYAGFMFARSGTGVKGLVLGNGTGVIDADYQGPLKVCLWNRSDKPIVLESGMRVAQLVILPVVSGYTLKQVTEFTDGTERGVGGFGSTGLK